MAGRRVDVRLRGGSIVEVAERLEPGAAEDAVDGADGALIRGLWDHHVHLAASAAADASVDLAGNDLDDAVRAADRDLAAGVPLRAVGYDETDHGYLDRARLDALVPQRPVRVQHRSGALWVLNSPALARSGHTYTDGRIMRGDASLTPAGDGPGGAVAPVPDVGAVARRLAAAGVVGVTDATPIESLRRLDLLVTATPWLDVVAMTGPALAGSRVPDPLRPGPVKVVLSDHQLPELVELTGEIRTAHAAGRSAALHCVTDAALALALAAFGDAGGPPPAAGGDRIEHGSVIPAEAIAEIARRGLTVVSQPGFVAAHGDRYLRDVASAAIGDLYRCGSLLRAGVRVAGSSDAPYGPEDPWEAIAAAIDRRTPSGAVLGADERLGPHRALGLFLGGPWDPGGRVRRVVPGAPADLCLLDAPLDVVLASPAAAHVVATFKSGRCTFHR